MQFPTFLRSFSRISLTLLSFLTAFFVYELTVVYFGGIGGFLTFDEDYASNYLFSIFLGKPVYFTPQYLELLFVVSLYSLNLTLLRRSVVSAFVAALPIFAAYLGQDIYYALYSGVFRIIELSEVPELLQVLPWNILGVVTVGLFLLIGSFVYYTDFQRPLKFLLLLPLVGLALILEFFPARYCQFYDKVGQPIEFWSDTVSVLNNGKFMMLFYHEAERRIVSERSSEFRNREAYDAVAQKAAEWLLEKKPTRNVHLVVLESFLDPTVFKKAAFSKDPIHPSFKKLFGKNASFSISPVFGGKTAQAEFEILCGVPALSEVTGVEFNAFTGASTNCLPKILSLAGYRTIGSNAYQPNFFNALNAYQGVGFSEIYFPKEYNGAADTYFTVATSEAELGYLFDGDFFEQNLEFISKKIAESPKTPIFNYLISMYGHAPYQLDTSRRPIVTKMTGPVHDALLELAANQTYYRTEAIATFATKLQKIDPKSLIIFIGDHLPAGALGTTAYQQLHYVDSQEKSIYLARLLVIDAGKVKKLDTRHHYQLSDTILDAISTGKYCKETPCLNLKAAAQNRETLRDRYLKLMAHASE